MIVERKVEGGGLCGGNDLTRKRPLRLNGRSVNPWSGRARRLPRGGPGASDPRVKIGFEGRLRRRDQVASEFDIIVVNRVNWSDGLEHHRVR